MSSQSNCAPLSCCFILDGDAETDPSSLLPGASVVAVLAKAFCSCPSISTLHLTHEQSLCLHSSQRSHLVWLVSDASRFLSRSGKHTHRKAATSSFPVISPFPMARRERHHSMPGLIVEEDAMAGCSLLRAQDLYLARGERKRRGFKSGDGISGGTSSPRAAFQWP